MKSSHCVFSSYGQGRSREGAWIEISDVDVYRLQAKGRSREGAWIEIHHTGFSRSKSFVAPARERGLKCADLTYQQGIHRRSREGAWIEIPCNEYRHGHQSSLPRGSVD